VGSGIRRSTAISRCTRRTPELLNRAGDAAGATRAYEQGIALTAGAVERAELERAWARCAK
jgi:predicted RNA polymerase sigma factor